MSDGYVALLDALGFRELVRSDYTGDRISAYFDGLSITSKQIGVKSVVFSDSMVLTSDRTDNQGLLDIAEACSRSMGHLLCKGIALRGAIAFGDIYRRNWDESVFVAGRAIIEAYEYEQIQEWIGVMLAPSVLERVPEIRTHCHHHDRPPDLEMIKTFFDWEAYIQHCPFIPFRTAIGGQTEPFDGFAIVPTSRHLTPFWMLDDLDTILDRLTWLRSVAPTAPAQRKYQKTLDWLLGMREARGKTQLAFEEAEAKQLREKLRQPSA